MKRLVLIVPFLLFLLAPQARGDGADDRYIQIYNLIQEADTLNNSSQSSTALVKYLDAQAALQRFQKAYPDWNSKAVTFRLSYVGAKVAEASAKVPGVKPTAPKAPAA